MKSLGERIRRERKRADTESRDVLALRALRTAGSSCANCAQFSPAPWMGNGKSHCEMVSGGGSYCVVKENNLCLAWRNK